MKRSLLWLSALVCLASPVVWAQDDAPVEEAPPPTPTLRVVGFRDRDPASSCPDYYRVYGWCVEEVDFLDLSEVWNSGTEHLPREERARLRTIGTSYAQLLEDMGLRWYREDDILSETFSDTKISHLPPAVTTWDPSGRHHNRIFSLADRELWLDREDWLGAPSEESVPFFRPIRYHHPTGVYDPPEALILRGRFATRLAYDGRRHNYDIMDGDKDSSGPFFEQMYPYTRGMESENKPLGSFIVKNSLKAPDVTPDDAVEVRRGAYERVLFSLDEGFAAGKNLASQEFEHFYNQVGTEIVRFGRAEYTPTHLRVLTALVAMHSPPQALAESVTTRDVVAASEGQTDDLELIESLVSPGIVSREELNLNISALPTHIVAYYVDLFPQWHDPDRDLLRNFNALLRDRVQHYVRDGTQDLTGTDPATLGAWVSRWALPAREPDIEKHILPTALEVLLDATTGQLRDKIETRLLLDHIDYEISTRFDPDPAFRTTPESLETVASGQWRSSLGSHGFFPQPIADGPGAVDPLAICTTLDRRKALSEPAFGAVNIDLLVVASDCLTTPEEVLWEVRGATPFIMIDNPRVTKPKVDRLVGLPGERAVYRVRWNIWNGWHFLWAFEPLDRSAPVDGEEAPGEDLRLVLRTGAVCEDTVLAAPDLVPTLARAALLDGEFRPSTPMPKGKRKYHEMLSELALSGELFERSCTDEPLPLDFVPRDDVPQSYEGGDGSDTVSTGATTSEGVQMEGEAGAEQVTTDPTNTPEQVEVRGTRFADVFRDRELRFGSQVEQILPERIAYIQDLMRAPLVQVAAQEQLLMVAVMDTLDQDRTARLWRVRPRSPYMLTKARTGFRSAVHTSSWATSIWGIPDDYAYDLLSPAYQPTESVSPDVGSPVPRWKRNRSGDFLLSTGLGPYARDISLRCPEESALDEANDYGTVQLCEAEKELTRDPQPIGLSLDLTSMFSIWALDQPRLGVELGPAIHFDMLWAGQSPLAEEDEAAPFYAWTFRPMVGLMLGTRLAPDPSPLWRWSRRAIPWGADGPNGASKLGRVQYGLRTGVTFGPGFNGLEADLIGEVWTGWSVRRNKSRIATLTPYYPKMLLGPYVRGLYGFVLNADADEARYQELAERRELVIGIRGQFRFNLGQPAIPELP